MKYARDIMLAAIVCTAAFFVIFFNRGVPIHDFNLWRLQTAYAAPTLIHPNDSIVLATKSYLGGPDEHGSQRCLYIIGEARSSPRPKDEIARAYQGLSIPYGNQRVSINILFLDDGSWSLQPPFGSWRNALSEAFDTATGTIYFVYVAQERPFLGDLRCDD